MYIPQQFWQRDPVILASFIRDNSFGMLVTILEGSPFATPIPFLFDRGRGANGCLMGHLARANPQWRGLDPAGEVTAIFQGPHAYISPAWYTETSSVPTWNYMAVHVYGTARITSTDELREILRSTVLTYEQHRVNPWRIESLTDEYVEKMAHGIVGFEIDITRIEGKFKLSQNRSEEDILNVINELQHSGAPESIALAEAMKLHSL